jgi:hypothetical protein
MYRFKLLCGVHNEDGQTYMPGAIVDSKSDLSLLDPTGERFQRLPDDPLPHSDPEATKAAALAGYDMVNELQPKKDSLDGMTVEQLREFAAETEVDLGKARTREQILAVLRSA